MTPADLSRTARRLYAAGPAAGRTIQSLRPYICPFDRLLPLIPPAASVLDVGCGSGLLTVLAADCIDVGRVVGFDSSPPAIALARTAGSSLTAAGRPVPEYQLLDATADWPAGLFDVVAVVDVLHHIPPAAQRAVVERSAAKVAPGGRLIYKDIGPRPRWRAAMNRLHDLVMARQWVRYVDAQSVRRWVEACGLRAEPVERINTLWYGHDLLVAERPN